jgi:hypothetical protein
MTPYAEIRDLVFELRSQESSQHLKESAAAGIFRARVLRALSYHPLAHRRRRALLFVARAYLSLVRSRRTEK